MSTGLSRSVSRVAGALPRTSTPAVAPASVRITVQPVGRSVSVKWPTLMPGTAVSVAFAAPADCAASCVAGRASQAERTAAHASDRARRFMPLQYRIVHPAPIERILAEVDRAADEIVQFTADLVRIPTVNPPGEEYDACAHFLGDFLKRRAFEIEYIA